MLSTWIGEASGLRAWDCAVLRATRRRSGRTGRCAPAPGEGAGRDPLARRVRAEREGTRHESRSRRRDRLGAAGAIVRLGPRRASREPDAPDRIPTTVLTAVGDPPCSRTCWSTWTLRSSPRCGSPLSGTDGLVLVRSGLDDTMRLACRELTEVVRSHPKPIGDTNARRAGFGRYRGAGEGASGRRVSSAEIGLSAFVSGCRRTRARLADRRADDSPRGEERARGRRPASSR